MMFDGTPSQTQQIPEAMRNARRWLVWKLIPNKDPAKKGRKVPFYVSGAPRSGELDVPEDRAQLGTLEEARQALATGRYTGLGFALGPDPDLGMDDEGKTRHWQGADLDHVSEHPEFTPLIDHLPGYAERSPSGDGWHALGIGRDFESLGNNQSGVEAYAHGRFFTFTGRDCRGDLEDIADFVVGKLAPMHKAGPGATQETDLSPPETSAPTTVSGIELRPVSGPLPAYTQNAEDELSPLVGPDFPFTAENLARLQRDLDAIPAKDEGTWRDVVWAGTSLVAEQEWPEAVTRALFDNWSRSAPDDYDERGFADRWRRGLQRAPGEKRIRIGTLIDLAQQYRARTSTPGSQTAPRKGGLTLTSVRELFTPPPPLEWLVKGFLLPQSQCVIFGDPAAGKSLLTLDWAASIALGRPWNGHKVKQGGVIYIAGEGHFGIRRRLLAWAIHNNAVDALQNAPIAVSSRGTQFTDDDAFDELRTAIDDFRDTNGNPALIVVDTLHRNLGGDDNAAADIGKMYARLDELRELYEATIVVVHHSGHGDKTRSRGSSAIRGSVDTELRVEVDALDVRTLSATKVKDAATPAPIHFKLNQVELPWQTIDGEFETSVVLVQTEASGKQARLTPNQRQCLQALRDAMMRDGTRPDMTGHDVPAKAVTEETWRKRYRELRHQDKADTVKKGFQREHQALLDLGEVQGREGWFWVPGWMVNE